MNNENSMLALAILRSRLRDEHARYIAALKENGTRNEFSEMNKRIDDLFGLIDQQLDEIEETRKKISRL